MKKVFIIIMSLFSIFAFSACEKSDLKKITVSEVAHSVFYAPFYVAKNLNYFEDEGLDVDIVLANGADKVMASLLSKDASIGLAGCEATIYVYNQGQNDYCINFAQLTQRDGNFLVSRSKEENFDYNNLKGKSILGGRRGGMPEMVLEYALKLKGLDVSRDDESILEKGGVNVRTDVQFAALAGSFASGEGDYVVLFEPTATLTEKAEEGYIVSSLGEITGYIPYTNFFCLKSYLEENSEVVEKFTKALYKGIQYVLNHDSHEIAEIIHPLFESNTIEELSVCIERYKSIDAWKENPVLNKEGYELFQNIMEMANELDKRCPYDKVVNTEIAMKVVNEYKK